MNNVICVKMCIEFTFVMQMGLGCWHYIVLGRWSWQAMIRITVGSVLQWSPDFISSIVPIYNSCLATGNVIGHLMYLWYHVIGRLSWHWRYLFSCTVIMTLGCYLGDVQVKPYSALLFQHNRIIQKTTQHQIITQCAPTLPKLGYIFSPKQYPMPLVKPTHAWWVPKGRKTMVLSKIPPPKTKSDNKSKYERHIYPKLTFHYNNVYKQIISR